MSLFRKLEVLSEAAQYDRCNYLNLNHDNLLTTNIPGICPSKSYDGRTIPLFKVLMTNKCINDCKYCINHNKHGIDLFEFSPDELVSVFLDYYHKKYVEGLFLSSGVGLDEDSEMGKMVEVAHQLRYLHGYQGYIHLKILPGTSFDLIKRALSLADRVSINLESATKEGFEELTSTKDYDTDIIRRMKWIKKLISKDKKLAPSGHTTQFIVGATFESDLDIMKRIRWLYDELNIERNYFSPFTPIKDTPMELDPPTPKKRVTRLYQTDFLVKYYGFELEELVFDENGNLNQEMDPKLNSALFHNEKYPIEINNASYHELLRVPGIGKISARRIIRSKRSGVIFKNLEDLKYLGVATKRAEPFIKLDQSYQSTFDW